MTDLCWILVNGVRYFVRSQQSIGTWWDRIYLNNSVKGIVRVLLLRLVELIVLFEWRTGEKSDRELVKIQGEDLICFWISL